MWTENGDKLSNQYAGTNSNISGVINNENSGFGAAFGKLVTGVKRYIKNTFSDESKNESIKLFLGRHSESIVYGIRDTLNKELLKRID